MYYATDDANEGINNLNNILEASSLIASDYESDTIKFLTDDDAITYSSFIIDTNTKGGN